MKSIKRVLSGVVALTMAVTTLAGCASQDNEVVELSYKVDDTAAVSYDLSSADMTHDPVSRSRLRYVRLRGEQRHPHY